MEGKILAIEDDAEMRFFLREALRKRGYEVELAESAEQGLERLGRSSYDLVLIDLKLPGMDGIEAIERIKALDSHAVIILMTAFSSRQTALEAIRRGAYDYFVKPLKLDEMEVVIKRALEKQRLMREVEELRRQLGDRYDLGRLIGKSRAMREVFELLRKVTEMDSTVLITGESGTGKELIAEALHYNSRRRSKPLVKLNCAAIPDDLLESELFGYEKGAFTGAVARKPGKFETAHGGTILLDEIADMPLNTQAKILRVIQEREFERLGSNEKVRVDVRIIASTNRDLAEAVREGKFREDLYFRLNVVPINIPPLRKRKEDIPLLVDYFLEEMRARLSRKISGVSREAMQALVAYDWPGNVRELRNYIERASILAEGETIELEHLPPQLVRSAGADEKGGTLDAMLDRVEREAIIEALERAGGVQALAAKLLGITERSMWHRVKKHGIDVEKFKRGKAQ